MSVHMPAIFPSGRRRKVQWLGGPNDMGYITLIDEEDDYFFMYEADRSTSLLAIISSATKYRVPIRNGKLYYYERELVND